MRIGGLQKFSLIDYPGKVAAVVFTQGCNFRCSYCHNAELVYPEQFEKRIPEQDVMTFLESRVGQLDGVVVTGGEPTLHDDLPVFLRAVKGLGFFVKLDTNGSNPAMVRALIAERLVDYIAMDIKSPFDKYEAITGVAIETAIIEESMTVIRTSRCAYEFRTTNVPDLVTSTDLDDIRMLLSPAETWRVNEYVEPRKAALV